MWTKAVLVTTLLSSFRVFVFAICNPSNAPEILGVGMTSQARAPTCDGVHLFVISEYIFPSFLPLVLCAVRSM